MEETRWGLNSVGLGSLSPTSRPQNPKPQLLTMPRAHSYTTSTSPKFSSPTNSSTVWFRPQATWTSPILLATARTRSTPYRWGRKGKDLPFCSKMGEAQTKEEVISALRSTYRTGEVTWGNFGVGTANATARVEEEWVPYLFEGAWELLPSVPRALADQAREQGRNLLWLQGTQSIVKHEFSEEQFMAAHGTSHPPCQLHRACLVYITQDSKHLEDRWWVLGTDHPLPCYPLCPPPLSPLLAGGTRGAATATDLTAGSAAAPSPSVSAFAPVASGTAESHRESHRQEHVSLPLTLKGKRELIGAGAAEDQS